MNPTGPDTRRLIRLQARLFYVLTVWFGVVAVLMASGGPFASELSYAGLVLLLLTVPVRVAVTAEQFRRAGLYRLAWLTYLLIVILFVVAIVRFVRS